LRKDYKKRSVRSDLTKTSNDEVVRPGSKMHSACTVHVQTTNIWVSNLNLIFLTVKIYQWLEVSEILDFVAAQF
jgi:hypothetical protein